MKEKAEKLKAEKLKSIEELLEEAGFQTLEKRGERIIHASGTADFGKSHAAFLQASSKHPALIGCSEFPSLGSRLLIVHRKKAETLTDEQPPATSNEQPATDQEQSD